MAQYKLNEISRDRVIGAACLRAVMALDHLESTLSVLGNLSISDQENFNQLREQIKEFVDNHRESINVKSQTTGQKDV